MKLVIDIDEKMYEDCKTRNTSHYSLYNFSSMIANGTPLPKGHGRLIYEPTKEEIGKTIGGQSNFAECIRDIVKTVFDNAPTIIEADKEG